jgi:adenylate kinase
MGVAGAGKSMQGRLLADEHGYAWISTGEILRVLVTGKRRQEMLEGKLLSDWEVIEILDKILDLINVKDEFVLDGFPRTIAQSDWLLEQVARERFQLSAVINLSTDEEVVRGRLLQRGRQDDNEAAIAERFAEYRSVTLPIIEHFEAEAVPTVTIDAGQSPKAVHDEITDYLNGKTVD